MSYYMNLYFKQLKNKEEMFDTALKIARLYYGDAEKILEERCVFAPSYDFGDEKGDKEWLNAIFTLTFIYWPEHNLLGLIKNLSDDSTLALFMDTFIQFQNSCDQNYDWSDWSDKINLFAESKKLFMPEHDLSSEEEYDAKTSLYEYIEKALCLHEYMNRKDDPHFTVFRIQSINNDYEELLLRKMLKRALAKQRELDEKELQERR